MGLKDRIAGLLEQHPFGYAFGVWLATSTDLFLPHERDYYAFRILARGRQTGLFLDVGANRGHSARGFAKLVPGWRVLSIEANPLHERPLRALAASSDRFSYRIAAADATSGKTCELFVPSYRSVILHSAAATSEFEARDAVEKWLPRHAARVTYARVRSETVRIDDLDVTPDIIKCDIQGKELDALRGARRTLETASPDVLVEILAGQEQILDFMTSLGYSAFGYRHGARAFAPWRAGDPQDSRNVFFSRRDLRTLHG